MITPEPLPSGLTLEPPRRTLTIAGRARRATSTTVPPARRSDAGGLCSFWMIVDPLNAPVAQNVSRMARAETVPATAPRPTARPSRAGAARDSLSGGVSVGLVAPRGTTSSPPRGDGRTPALRPALGAQIGGRRDMAMEKSVGTDRSYTSAMERDLVRLQGEELSVAEAVAHVIDSAAGGICVFAGTVRDVSDGLEGVTHLEYE